MRLFSFTMTDKRDLRAISIYTMIDKNNKDVPPKPSCSGLERGTTEFKRASAAAMQWKRMYVPGFREKENERTKAASMATARVNGVQPAHRLVPIKDAPPKPKLEGKFGSLERNPSIAARLRWNRRYVPGWKERVTKHDVNYCRNKRSTNPDYKLYGFLRCSIGRALKYTDSTRQKRTLEYVGCTVKELRIHLESQFNNDMNWAGYGTEWQVDHIIPLASALPVSITAHYTNLQPLPAAVNNAKDNKIIPCYLHKIIAHPGSPDELLDVALALLSY